MLEVGANFSIYLFILFKNIISKDENSHNIEQINGKKKDKTGVHNLSEKITYQTKRLKDLHISIVFKALLVNELEIIPK